MRRIIEDERLIEEELTTPITVSEVNGRIALLIDSEPDLSGISMIGEVSDLRRYDSGHWYFSLKDDKSQIRAVMWRSAAARQISAGFIPENGMTIVANGDIRVYEANGVYQVIVQRMSPAGEGARYAAFLKLKKKLQDEGLMDEDRKVTIPAFVESIALVTSPTSAAAKDFLKVAAARWKGVRITIVPAVMQGSTAPSSVIGALLAADKLDDVQVIALVRGGGSSEDLWCFNDEALARAIAAVRKPIVAGIGHEVDLSIADMVADLRASTPSNAAELIVPDCDTLSSTVDGCRRRIGARFEENIARNRASLLNLIIRGPLARPLDIIDIRRQALDDCSYSLRNSMIGMVDDAKASLDTKNASVIALNPDAILSRGYAVCVLPDGTIVRNAGQAKPGADVEIRLHKGTLDCVVKQISG